MDAKTPAEVEAARKALAEWDAPECREPARCGEDMEPCTLAAGHKGKHDPRPRPEPSPRHLRAVLAAHDSLLARLTKAEGEKAEVEAEVERLTDVASAAGAYLDRGSNANRNRLIYALASVKP